MDQDGFRSLLAKPGAPGANVTKSKAYNRGSLLAAGASSAKKAEPSPAEFKPRKVKKPTDSKYRDRASERRVGVNEYADVEGILQDFEKRTEGEDKDAIEEQRRYLGGDATHTVLVKGLDFALLEQNLAREETREDLDEDLESAFLGTSLTPAPEAPSTSAPTEAPPGKKRTRAELLAELQKSRGAEPDSAGAKTSTREAELEALERAKQAGKFKPMGASSFAPVEKKKKKKKKVVVEGEAKEATKKAGVAKGKAKEVVEAPAPILSDEKMRVDRPAEGATLAKEGVPPTQTSIPAQPELPNAPPAPTQPSRPAEPVEDVEDLDPFADAGDYEPDYGDDSDAEDGDKPPKQPPSLPPPASTSAPSGKRNWFNEPEPEPEPAPVPAKPPTPPQNSEEKEEGEEVDMPKAARLAGLSSSAMPSVAEFLAMDKEEEEREKKRARKEKKKKGG
ncbi:hypothetical protein BDV93DRAFT_521259 [Ceratobasidium sp. AG-I]|nr:hypothetical protein BDV93DRAFT_521259 [Ceratobasidium sp. AG-I]